MSISLSIRTLFNASPSNEWMMERYADSGDSRLLEKLYDNCSGDLYHFMLTQSDPVLARDICQKTWLKVIEKRQLYRPSGRFIAWLFTMARHLLIDELRQQNRWQSDETVPEQNIPFDSHSDLQEAFNQVLMSLPLLQREAFTLQQEGFGILEIANITGDGVETIKSRIRYAKSTLRTQLEKYHD